MLRRILPVLLLCFAATAFAESGEADPACADADLASRLSEIRARIRAEAGTEPPPALEDDGRDLPMVAVTVLPGDDHRLLARDLTGTVDTQKILSFIQPTLTPGEKLLIPRALLTPRLSDQNMASFVLGSPHKTLWKLVQAELDCPPGEAARLTRNLLRMNHIVDVAAIKAGTAINVPASLLRNQTVAAPRLAVSKAYRVKDLRGLSRGAPAGEIPSSLAQELKRTGQWELQKVKPPLDLVVVHTTEHNAATLDAVGNYVKRHRLANYLIGPKGEVFEVVPPTHRAFGSGESLWEGRYRVDHQAVNIEIYANTAPDGPRYTGIRPEQYTALRDLVALLRSRYPAIHSGRVVTHRMVAMSYRFGNRSRKGDPYEFDWAAAGLPDNSIQIDQDLLLGRTTLCLDKRYADRVTEGQEAAASFLKNIN